MKLTRLTSNELRARYPHHTDSINDMLRTFRITGTRGEPTLVVYTECPVTGAHLSLTRSDTVDRFADSFMIEVAVNGYAWNLADETTTYQLLTTPILF